MSSKGAGTRAGDTIQVPTSLEREGGLVEKELFSPFSTGEP